jgi:hypothetical protein
MNAAEFAMRMRECADICKADPEAGHSDADQLMCETLRALGYGEGVAIFETMETWCA